MIIDNWNNSGRIEGLHPAFKQIFDYIKSMDWSSLTPGKIELDGENVYLTIAETQGKEKESAFLEAHREYIDIQFPLEGKETYGWTSSENLKQEKEAYRPGEDIAFFSDKAEVYFTLEKGKFVVFFPGEGHAPCIGASPIKKVIAKIRATNV